MTQQSVSFWKYGMAAMLSLAIAQAAPATAQTSAAEPAVKSTPSLSGAFDETFGGNIREPVMAWSVNDAQALLKIIRSIDAEGLIPADYEPDKLSAALLTGAGDALNQQASRSFAWLVEDMRDGRTPVPARVQWFALDPDRDTMPTEMLMATALASHDIKGVIASLAPTVPDYARLREELSNTPRANKERRALIQVNMDRWRWLPRDLGDLYLLTNVPEFHLRLTVNNNIVRTYRTIVGKPGRTATPQLAEKITGIVINPTWTVPQSIVKGEGLGSRLLANPASARRQGYKVTKLQNGMISVVQQPGDNNALGRLKIDMPNPHAIYLHDTPNKSLFNSEVRAFSHGCIRTERAVELGMTMAILGADKDADDMADIYRSGKYTRVNMVKEFPVYITYFTIAQDIDGNLQTFKDLYSRDAPVLKSFASPRRLKTAQRISSEPVIKLDNPL